MNRNLQINPYQIGDEEAICDLFHTVFKGIPFSCDYWNWRFRNSPSGKGVISLSWNGSILASHYAVTPVMFSILCEDHLNSLSGTTMTNPDYRGQGLFPLLAEDVYAHMKNAGMIFVFGFPNFRSHRTIVKNLAWHDIYEIPFFRLELTSIKVAPEPNGNVIRLNRFDDSFNGFWATARKNYPIIGFRDKDQLNWRYIDNPVEDYSILANVSGSGLLGYAVYKQYKDELQIVDILTAKTEPKEGLALVFEMIRLAIEMKLNRVSMWLNLNTPLHRELEKFGFKNDAPITYFGARILNNIIPEEMAYNMNNWYLTMGDSDVF